MSDACYVSFDLSYDEPALQHWDEVSYEFVVELGTVGASSADIGLNGQIHLIVLPASGSESPRLRRGVND